MTALIFDCDGVLADTERDGHRVAFNRTFEEFGLPVRWSEVAYGDALKIAGGKERMTSLLTPEFVARAGLPTDEEGQREEVARWHRRKTEIYTEMVAEGKLPARPGVARIASDAIAASWSVAVASTSSEASVRAVLEHVVGKASAERFVVLAGDVVPAKKPAPDIYLLTLDRLDDRSRGQPGDRGFPERAAGGHGGGDRLPRDRERLHGSRRLLGGRPRRVVPR